MSEHRMTIRWSVAPSGIQLMRPECICGWAYLGWMSDEAEVAPGYQRHLDDVGLQAAATRLPLCDACRRPGGVDEWGLCAECKPREDESCEGWIVRTRARRAK